MGKYGQDRLNFAFGVNFHMYRFLCPEHLIVRDSKDESEIFGKVPVAILTNSCQTTLTLVLTILCQLVVCNVCVWTERRMTLGTKVEDRLS